MLYADNFTESMVKSLWETYRRRSIQNNFNIEHHITPKAAHSNVKNLESVKTDEELVQQQNSKFTRGKVKRLKRMTKSEKNLIMKDLKSQMDEAIKVTSGKSSPSRSKLTQTIISITQVFNFLIISHLSIVWTSECR